MKFPILIRVLLVVSISVSAPTLFSQTPYEQECAKLAGQHGNDSQRLRDLFKLDWDYTMCEHP